MRACCLCGHEVDEDEEVLVAIGPATFRSAHETCRTIRRNRLRLRDSIQGMPPWRTSEGD